MKSSLAGIPGAVVVASLLAGAGLLSAQDAFYFDGANQVPLKEEPAWTGYELAAGSDPANVEADVRRSARKAQNRAAVYDAKRRLLAVPAENAVAPKGAVRKVRLFKNGTAEPIMETRELVVRFKDGVTRAKANRFLKPLKGTILSPIGEHAPNAYLVAVPAGVSSIDTANRLQAMPEVRYAQPDLIWPKVARFAPDDPMYPQQWHLNNPGGSGGIAGADIKAERAWEITRGDPNVVIAILDDGVATGHEDFASGKFTGGWDFIGNDNNPQPGRTVDNHGTSCAGLAAASGNNGLGVTGVAPDCRMMPVRMLGPTSTPTMEAAAIAHAKNNGAWVISNSWGPADGTGANFPCPQIVNDAIVDAADNGRGGKGCVILWAAGNGNESSDLDGYASHPKVICVGATLRNDTRSPYSDFGVGMDICAPGGSAAGDMVTVDRMGAAGYDPSSNYDTTFNGTSAATPVAAGVAALILSAEPDLTRQEVTQRLIDTADFIDTANVTYDSNGHHNWYGFGRVNAFAALAAGDTTNPTVTVQVPSQGQISASAPTASGTTSDTGYGAYLVHWWVFNRATGKWWNASTSSWQDGTGSGATVSPTGNNWNIPLPATGEGSFQLHVKVEDKAGNESGFTVRDYQIDNGSPSLTIHAPAAGNQATPPPLASGTATDSGSGVKEIRVSRRSVTTDRWWKWSDSSWTGPGFAWADHVVLASGTTSWSRSLPVLPEGSYELFIQALDNSDAPSAWTPRSFSIDGSDPVVTFTGLVNQQQVFDFANISGTVSEPATVTLKLTEFNVSGTNRYWNGSNWTTNESDPAVWRPAIVSGNAWQPQSPLPGRGNTRQGHYILEVKAVDVANKQDLESLVLVRTATDTTVPELAILSPVAAAVVTDPVLPSVGGTVSDPESGIAGVSIYVMRSTGSGFSYWTGSGWSLTPTELPAQSNGSTWSAPVTSGPGSWSMPSYGQIVNGAWQIQVSSRNGEIPAGTRGASVAFTVDYHPVYEFTAGSYSDGDAHNDNMLFGNPANWSPYGVPGANDIALIQNNHHVTSTASVNLYGFRMNSGSLTFSAGPGPDGQLTTSGKSEWQGGTFNGLWTNTGTLVISGAVDHWLWYGSSLTNTGTVTHSAGVIVGRESCTITNSAGGTWISAAAGDLFNNYNGGNQFISHGVLRQTAATDSELNDWTFTLGGQIEKQGAVLGIRANATLSPGVALTGAGSVRVIDGTVTTSTTLSNSGGEFQMTGGTLSAPTPVALTGPYFWIGGAWQGSLALAAGSTLTIGGSPQLNPGTVFNNAGTVTWASDHPLIGRENVRINNTGTWRLDGIGDAFANYNGGNVFNNEGLLEKTGSSVAQLAHWYYLLPGDTRATTGVLNIHADFAWPAGAVFSGSGTIQLNGGTWALGGEVTSTVNTLRMNNGTLNGAAGAKIQGNWIWSGGHIGGSLENPAGRTLTLDGWAQLNPNTTLLNLGTVLWQGTSPLVGRENVRVNNLGTWRIQSPGDAFANYNGGNVFNNEGLLEKTGPDTAQLAHWYYLLPGDTRSTAGILNIHADTTWPAGAIFSGSGTIQLNGGTWALGGEVTSTVSTLRMNNGTLNGATGAKLQGDWILSGGYIGGSFENPAGRTLTFDGWSQLNPGTSLLNNGTVVWRGTSPVLGRENVSVTNAAGATWEIAANGAPFANYNYGNSFTNYGLLTRTAPSGEVHLNSWTYHQHGIFHATAGDTRIGSALNLMEGCSFTGAGTFSLLDQTWLKGATTFTANTLTYGAFHGEAAGAIHGSLQWAAGSMDGLVQVATGATLRVTTPAEHWLWTGGLIDCGGAIVWEDGNLMGRENATIRIRNAASFGIVSAATMGNYNYNNHLVIDDGGTLTKTGAGTSAIHWAFDNDGSAAVNAGLISLHGGGLGDGAFSGNSGGVLRFADGPHVLEAGATTSGGVEITGGSAVANGAASGRIDVKAGTFGSIDSGVFSFAGASTWTGGVLYGQSSVPSGASLVTSGPEVKWVWVNSTVNVSGLLEWQGGHPIMGRENATIDVKSGGTFRSTADGDLFGNYNYGNRLLMAGTFEKNGGSGNTYIDEWAVEGAGIIRPMTGKLEFNTVVSLNGGTQYQGAGRTRFVGNNLYARGTATIATGSTVELAGAWIHGHADGTATFQGGAIEWSAGVINGLVTMNSSTEMNGGAEKWIWAGSELRNGGTMTLGGTGSLIGRESSRLVNLQAGTMNCPGTSTFHNYNYGNRLVNEGLLRLGGPVGRHVMHWTFQQTATGTLAIEVGGSDATTPEFDILQIHHPAELAGTLSVTKLNGYQPVEDTTFTFLTGSPVSGAFTTVQANGFEVEYPAGSVLLRAGGTGLDFEDWADDHSLAGANRAANADPDQDGVGNFLEYAFNTDPTVRSAYPVTSSVMTIASQKWVVVKYRRWQDRIDAGVGYQPERSATLGSWNATGMTDEADPDAPAVAGSEARRCRIPLAAGKGFLRLRVE